MTLCKKSKIPTQQVAARYLGRAYPKGGPKKTSLGVGGFLLRKFDIFNFYMVSSCSILFTDFGTVFVFALG